MVIRFVETAVLANRLYVFDYLSLRRAWYGQPSIWWSSQTRLMTTSKRVQDRSRNKRINAFEIATEKWKTFSKVKVVMDVLKNEPEMVIPVRSLSQYRTQISLPKPHTMADFIRKSPKLFELYKDPNGLLWCGMTKEAEELMEEEKKLLEEHSDKAAEYVTRCLMMSVDKRLPLEKIAHFRREFGLPLDFRNDWVHKYPQLFRVVKIMDDEHEHEHELEYLELVTWNPDWAITELEKAALGLTGAGGGNHTPEMLSLPFPLKFPTDFKKVYRYAGKIEHFQKRSYLSPYADASELKAGSLEFDKRAVAVMHELLSFTIEKRLVTDHLTHFRREFVMPQKLMRLLLKHFGIFYVSERGKRFSVFLTQAYEDSELIEKGPLVLWKEKLLSLCGYRGKRKPIQSFSDLSDMEDKDLLEQEETLEALEDSSLADNNDEMEIEEVHSAYKDTETS